ncbi:MAG: undecaprenyl/decaprenyl-phosphate alpha-N-acetylglucosaminyl 1-phosphate transferase [Actinomycetota bacterium]|nr:undecaprenyl/decaprenyl-phosphate alpha-N-acetylglucosaminyl 1-phosphate transferase [Actinomycetota bacterium]
MLGGTAVFAGFLTLKLFEVASGRGGIAAWDVGLVTGVVCFILLGTVDDCRPLTPSVKLVAQTAATVPALVLSGGEYGTTGLIGATLFLVLLVNAYNLVDVMDGLLCILAGPAIASLVLTPGLVPTEWKFELWVALGSVSALFLFNRPPARIYGGDAGSMTLGFLLGYIWLGLAGREGLAEAAPVLVLFAIPLAEVALLVAARARRGLSVFRASPDHFSLRVRDQRGWSRWRILAMTFAVGGALSLAPPVMSITPRGVGLSYVAACAAVLAVLFACCWRLHPRMG